MSPTQDTTPIEEAQIEAESIISADNQNDDSDYASASEGSETYSLTSSINQYIVENGRRYHTYWGTEKNPMPSDDVEQERLDILHECTRLINGGKLYRAPIGEQVHRVLDLGTGTGAWALDFAGENLQAEIIGIDLCPNMPRWMPPNCRFEVDDFEEEWTYSAPFDFIHARTLVQSVNNWPKLLKQALKHLKPGGWMELGEYYILPECDDDTIPPSWPPNVICELILEGLEKAGRKNLRAPEMGKLLSDAGFEEVHIKGVKLPIGPWPKNPVLKQAGAAYLELAKSGYEAYAFQLCTKVLGMSEQETKRLCDEARAAHEKPEARNIHAYMYYYTAYGRKPQSA